MTLFFDANFSHHLVRFIRDCGPPVNVVSAYERGWQNLDDDRLIELVCEKGWSMVTMDKRMVSRQLVIDVLSRSGRIVVCSEAVSHMSNWDKARWLLRYFHRIVSALESAPESTSLWISSRAQIKETPLNIVQRRFGSQN